MSATFVNDPTIHAFAFLGDLGGNYRARPLSDSEVEHYAAGISQGFLAEMPTHILDGHVGELAVVIEVTGRVRRVVPRHGAVGYRARMHLANAPGESNDVVPGFVAVEL